MEDFLSDFIPYDRALRMKELGFNKPCFGFWKSNIKYQRFISDYGCNSDLGVMFGKEAKLIPTAPTFSQAFRWFREKYELTWEHTFDDSQIQLYIGEIAYPDNCLDFFKSIEVKYDCYNEAYEEAELACLDELIKIIEQQNK